MVLKVADRIKQTTTTSGTGDISFTGTPTGFATFGSVLTNGDTTYYAIEENDKWEVGIGTYGSDNMVRTYVLASSNSGNAINLGGSGVVFISYPADKSVYRDAQSQLIAGASGVLFPNGTIVKDAKLPELTDVTSSGVFASTHVLSFNNTNKSLLLGDSTGPSNSNNNLIGYGAASGTTGTDNVVIGTNAFVAGNGGIENIVVGTLAGTSEPDFSSSASYCVSVGHKAGSRMRSNSTAIGHQAGIASYEFGFVAVGSAAGSGIGGYSVAVGYQAGNAMASDYVVSVGHQAGKSAAGESSVWVGNMAGNSATSASKSIGIGYQAGKSSSSNDSIYIGQSAGQSNSDDDYLYIGNGSPSSSRTLIKGDMQSKRLAIGVADVTLSDTLYIGVASSVDTGLVVRGAASQTANLTEWQDLAGTNLAHMASSGILAANGLQASGQGLTLESSLPTNTSNTLWNAGGSLYWGTNTVGVPTGVAGKVSYYNIEGSLTSDADFAFDSGNTTLTVGSVTINSDLININEAGGRVRVGRYVGDTGITESNYSVMLGYATAINASGSNNSVIVGNYAGFSTLNTNNSQIIGNLAGIYSSGERNTYIGDSAGSYSSGTYNTFIGNNAGKYCVGGQNIEILASGAANSVIDGYSNKVNIGNTIIGDTSNKKLAVGNVGASNVTPDATLEILPKNSTDIGVIVQGAASQSANLQEWQASNAVSVAELSADGSIATSGTISASGGVLLTPLVPSVTTNRLYNDSGTLKFSGSVIGGGSSYDDTYVSGVAVYSSGQAIENETGLVYASGSAAYASGQAIENEGLATYASGQAIENETDLIYASGSAAYASGQAIENEGLVTYASGQAIENETAIATNTSNVSTNTSNISTNTGRVNYASGQAVQNEIDLAYTSGIATYASGNTIVNDGLIAYASGNTANINFGSNSEGDILYHDGTSFTRLAKGTNNYILTMNGNVPNWEASAGGGGISQSDFDYASGVANYASGQAIENEGDLVYASGSAAYASGQAIENEGLVTYASGQAIENETAIATNTSNISTNTSNISTNSGRVTYASGQAIQNEIDIAYTSGIATYASGNTIVNDGLIAYASGNTANIAFGSNAEGDILYHNGTSFVRLAKGTNNYILKMNGNVPNWEAESSGGDVSAADFNYVSGVANYASGQAIENETDLIYASGSAAYASGQAIENEGLATYASGLAITNELNVAYASGQAIENETAVATNTSNISTNTTNIATNTSRVAYASGQAIDNETDIAYVSGVATYASGQAIENEGLATYASGQAIANQTATATNTSNVSTNTTNITTNSGRVTYASGQAIQNEIDIAYVSGVAAHGHDVSTADLNHVSGIAVYASGSAAYASGNTIVNDGLIAYASGNTANIAFGSNAEGDILYHNGSTFVRLAKGTDNHILKMAGNVPNWEAETSDDDTYVSGVAAYSSGVLVGGIPNFNVVGINTTTPEYGIDVKGGGASGVIQATGVKLGASGVVFSDGTTQTVAGAPATVDLTAGDGLTGGGTIASNRTFAVGAGTLIDVQADQVDVDLSEAAAATIAHGDNLIFIDGGATGTASKGSTDDLANLLAGDGLTKSNSVMAVNVDDSTIETNSDAIRVKDDGITLAKMAGLARGKIIYGDSSGNPAALALGGANQVLTSDGTDAAWADNVNTYLSGVAVYSSGQAIENETGLVYASGSAAYASGQAIENETGLVYASGSAAYSSGVLTGGVPNFSSVGVNTASPAYPIDVVQHSGVVRVSGVKGHISTHADEATVRFDINQSTTHGVTLGGNRTLAVANAEVGDKFLLRLHQDSSGSRTVTWFTHINWAGGSAPTLTTAAGKADLIGFLVASGTGSSYWYDGLVVGQNI